MSQFDIDDLNFFEQIPSHKDGILRGASALTPRISTDLSTDLATLAVTDYSISGNLTDGFKLNLLGVGSAAAAASAAVSIGGRAVAGSAAGVSVIIRR